MTMASTSEEKLPFNRLIGKHGLFGPDMFALVDQCIEQQAPPEIPVASWLEEFRKAARTPPVPVMDVVVRLDDDTQKRISDLEASWKWLSRVTCCLISPQAEAISGRFHALITRWKSERGHSSFIRDLCTHEAYQQIIGLGPAAIPLLLAEFEKSPGHYDWALRSITGANPVPAESRGKLKEMAAAWVAWGKQQGLEW
jgi:hypothetical protein